MVALTSCEVSALSRDSYPMNFDNGISNLASLFRSIPRIVQAGAPGCILQFLPAVSSV